MRLRLVNTLFGGVAIAAIAFSGSASANDGSFIVGTEVISDTVAAPQAYVGDLPSAPQLNNAKTASCATGGCATGGCETGGCETGGCESGGCSVGECESCGGGECGSCGDSCRVGLKGRLAGLAGKIGGCGAGDCGSGSCGDGGCYGPQYGQPDLFYNFFSQGNCNQTNAQMYISPLPVPHFVGHTYYTYQPFYPHELMYGHKNRFHNYYDNGRGLNRTRVNYSTDPIRSAAKNFYWNKLRLPR
ncbi:MAG: hypothetical protein AAFX06_23405 [Planctomycetota bacterium]